METLPLLQYVLYVAIGLLVILALLATLFVLSVIYVRSVIQRIQMVLITLQWKKATDVLLESKSPKLLTTLIVVLMCETNELEARNCETCEPYEITRERCVEAYEDFGLIEVRMKADKRRKKPRLGDLFIRLFLVPNHPIPA